MPFPTRHFTTFPWSRLAAVLLLMLSATGCQREQDEGDAAEPATPDPQRAAIAEVLDQAARKQAAGLGDGRVTVHGAWNYTGYSTLSPLPDARLVAVDITTSGHTLDFDFDDIEIVDAKLKVSYGSDPQLIRLNAEGQPAAATDRTPIAPEPTRLLLIYGYPADSQQFDLRYWHQKLTAAPVSIQDSGWELPYPEPAPGSNSSPPSTTPPRNASPAAVAP